MSMGSGAAEGLQQVLQRLFLEAKFKQDQMEHGDRMELGRAESAQRSRGLDIQEEGNRINAGMRDAQIKSLERDRTERGIDRDDQRKVAELARLQGSLQMTPRGTAIDNPDTIVGMVRGHMGGMLKPVQNEPRFEFSGTQQQLNTEQRASDTEEWRGIQAGLADVRNDISAARAESAGQKPSITPTVESNIINRLTNQWTKAISPAAELSRQTKMMDAGIEAARRGDLAQGAQAVLVTFQKILDPTSVVRESEYKRSGSGLALVDRAKGQLEQWIKGGAGVPLSELEKFAALAKQAVNAQVTGYTKQVKERIGKTADRYNIPRDLVFEDFEFGSGQSAQPTAAPAAAAPASTQETKEQRMQRLLKASGGQ